MGINDRINKLKGRFKAFNIAEGTIYVLIEMDNTWATPSDLSDFNVKTASDENGTYFFTDVANGSDCVFDAIDHVIEFNEVIEEKKSLFREKMNELSDIFAAEDIDKLRTLQFVMKKPSSRKANKAKKTVKAEKSTEDVIKTQDKDNIEEGIKS